MDREEGYGNDEGYDATSASNGSAAEAAGGNGAPSGSFAAAASGGASTSSSAGGRSQEVLKVTVTEVVDANEFFVQVGNGNTQQC